MMMFEKPRFDLTSTAEGGDAPFCELFHTYGSCWQTVARSASKMMHGGFTMSGELAWAVFERLQDPLAWCLIGIVIVLAIQGYRWWQALLITSIFAAFNIGAARVSAAASEFSFSRKEAWLMLVALLIIGLVAHGGGQLILRLRARRSRLQNGLK